MMSDDDDDDETLDMLDMYFDYFETCIWHYMLTLFWNLYFDNDYDDEEASKLSNVIRKMCF